MSEDQMPPGVKKVHERLSNELSFIHLRWKMYRQVFGTSPERIDLVNEFAPAFFRVVQETLADVVFLGIARLVDPVKSMGKANLVLEQLIVAVDGHDGGLADRLKLRDKLVDVRAMCEVFIKRRKKRLAHNDLETMLTKGADGDLLPLISRQHVEDALEGIRHYMNTVQNHFENGSTLYEHVITPPGDGEAIVSHLQRLKGYRHLYGRLRSDGRGGWLSGGAK
jgi:AbiU2